MPKYLSQNVNRFKLFVASFSLYFLLLLLYVKFVKIKLELIMENLFTNTKCDQVITEQFIWFSLCFNYILKRN